VTASSSSAPETSASKLPSREDYWREVRDEPDSWWDALPRTVVITGTEMAELLGLEPPEPGSENAMRTHAILESAVKHKPPNVPDSATDATL
jgi:hypothetical protein